jgi:8-oxo-dGTP diphosphatase
MQGYNVIAVYNKDKSKLLMCKRKRNPYKGLNNLVGGKIELNESGINSAYRELFEETNISSKDIKLQHLMDFTYYIQDCYVEVYVGKLNREMPVFGEENDLYWIELSNNFFDMKVFAGEGNIGHILEQVKLYEDKLLLN